MTFLHIHTDHRNLLFMQNSVNAKVQRWFSYPYIFDLDIEYVPGIDMTILSLLMHYLASSTSIKSKSFQMRQTPVRSNVYIAAIFAYKIGSDLI